MTGLGYRPGPFLFEISQLAEYELALAALAFFMMPA
jgi:hypothetical protein